MALNFDAVDDKGTVASTAITGVPFTMACWFNVDDTVRNHVLMCLSDTSADNDWFALEVRNDSADVLSAQVVRSSFAQATSSIAVTASVWHHGCAVFASATS